MRSGDTMCFDYDVHNDFQSSRYLTARKPHRCYSCGRVIQPGELYWRFSSVADGDFACTKLCGECSRDEQRVADWEEESGCNHTESHPALDEIREAAADRGLGRSSREQGQEFLKAKREVVTT